MFSGKIVAVLSIGLHKVLIEQLHDIRGRPIKFTTRTPLLSGSFFVKYLLLYSLIIMFLCMVSFVDINSDRQNIV